MKLDGKVLWLTESTADLARQLAGEDLKFSPTSPPKLAYGVNTDAMISGAACTLGYTGDVLGPHFLQDFQDTVAEGDVQRGDFAVVVGGHAYGSGSSREVAVVAHQGAGVQLVVAQSLQRIFQENLVYSGLPFTTDFRILERLLAGEDVPRAELAAALPGFFRGVAEHGGLLSYGTALSAGKVAPPRPSGGERGLTCVEKIIVNNMVGGEGAAVRPGDQVLCRTGFRGLHEYTAAMVLDLYRSEWGEAAIERPSEVAAFEDHFVLLSHDAVPETVKSRRLMPAMRLTEQMIDRCESFGVPVHGPGRNLRPGVCHRIVLEDYGRPGSIVVLTDSHTPTAGVLNAFAFGVGSTAMAFALRTGMIPVTVPKTVRVHVRGRPDDIVSPKDLILHLIGDPFFREEKWRERDTDTCVIQFGGPGLDHWSVDELSVLTNMTVEGGLMTGIVEPCASVEAFLRERDANTDWRAQFVSPDSDAAYVREIEVDLSEVPLTIATPGDSRNRAALADHVGVPVHNVVVASCTGGSLADLRAAARVLRGRKIQPGVRLTVTPSSAQVFDAAEGEGLLDLFRALGAVVTPPGCGSCIGNGPGIPDPGQTTASTTNRNFDRRMGAEGPVYLVSPPVAAAAAVTGTLCDPRSLPPSD